MLSGNGIEYDNVGRIVQEWFRLVGAPMGAALVCCLTVWALHQAWTVFKRLMKW